jgi:hypothetical protein
MTVDQTKVRQMLAEGLSTAEVAAEVGCTQRHVVRIRAGRTSGSKDGRRFSLDEIFLIEAMLDDGCSYTEIGKTVGRAPNTISHRWPGHGWGFTEGGEFRSFTRKLEGIIDQIWARHLTPAR